MNISSSNAQLGAERRSFKRRSVTSRALVWYSDARELYSCCPEDAVARAVLSYRSLRHSRAPASPGSHHFWEISHGSPAIDELDYRICGYTLCASLSNSNGRYEYSRNLHNVSSTSQELRAQGSSSFYDDPSGHRRGTYELGVHHSMAYNTL